MDNIKAVLKRVAKLGTLTDGEDGNQVEVPYWVSTGSAQLDLALGFGAVHKGGDVFGGIAGGRVCEAFGWESEGKSTLGMHCIASAQALDLNVFVVDTELSFTPERAKGFGIDTKEVSVLRPKGGDPLMMPLVFDAMVAFVKKNHKSFIVWDTLANTAPSDHRIGTKARDVRSGFVRLLPALSHTKSTLLVLNQVYKTFDMFTFGLESEGGGGIKFSASQRLWLRTKGGFAENGVPGKTVVATVRKSKVSVPLIKVEFPMLSTTGFCIQLEVADYLLSSSEYVKKSQGYWTIVGDKDIKERRIADKDLVLELRKDPKLFGWMLSKMAEVWVPTLQSGQKNKKTEQEGD